MLCVLQGIERIFVRLYESKYSTRCLYRTHFVYVTKPNIVVNIRNQASCHFQANSRFCVSTVSVFSFHALPLKNTQSPAIHAQSQLSETLFLARIYFYRVLVFKSPLAFILQRQFPGLVTVDLFDFDHRNLKLPQIYLCRTDLSSTVSCESPCHVVQRQSGIKCQVFYAVHGFYRSAKGCLYHWLILQELKPLFSVIIALSYRQCSKYCICVWLFSINGSRVRVYRVKTQGLN